MFLFQALSSRRIQRGFYRVNLHRPTRVIGPTLHVAIGAAAGPGPASAPAPAPATACIQGLTLLHFSAQRKRFLWDRGCV